MNIETSRRFPITVLIAVKNEKLNLPKCLAALTMMERIVVIDSNSTDGTQEIALSAGAELVQFSYKGGYPKKRQWALNTLEIRTPWVMLLDADEVVTRDLASEIENVILADGARSADAYLIEKGFHFMGDEMKYGGFSFAAVMLFKRGSARFEELIEDVASGLDMEIHERLIVTGSVSRLKNSVVHHDFKNLESYIDRHNKYSTWEAMLRYHFLTCGSYGASTVTPKLFGNSQEQRRWFKKIVLRLPFEAWIWFFYHFFFRLGFLEGERGLVACRVRAAYIQQVRAKVYELQLSKVRSRRLYGDNRGAR